LNIEKLNELEKTFSDVYDNNVIFDGITNINEYKKTPVKILWVLKEPNDPNQASWDLRKLHKNITEYSEWRRTYKLIIKISFAIIHNLFDYKLVPNEEKIKDILNNIAFINIKKVGGFSRSTNKIIRNIYAKNKDVILKQIKYIDPMVIINCSTVIKVMEDLQIAEIKKINKFKAARFNNGIIINAYHPNCRYKHNIYFNNIMGYIRENK
jgi:hypothetical protein